MTFEEVYGIVQESSRLPTIDDVSMICEIIAKHTSILNRSIVLNSLPLAEKQFQIIKAKTSELAAMLPLIEVTQENAYSVLRNAKRSGISVDLNLGPTYLMGTVRSDDGYKNIKGYDAVSQAKRELYIFQSKVNQYVEIFNTLTFNDVFERRKSSDFIRYGYRA